MDAGRDRFPPLACASSSQLETSSACSPDLQESDTRTLTAGGWPWGGKIGGVE